MTTETNAATMTPLAAGMKVVISKGCRDRGIVKGARATITSVTLIERNAVRVAFEFPGRRVAFYARHVNRLADATVRLNDGNPLHTIEVRRA